jgi:hypothetical protein
VIPEQSVGSQAHEPVGQSLVSGPTLLPDWQRPVLRQKPQPERGVQVSHVVLVEQPSAGGGGGVVREQSVGFQAQSL